MTRKGNWMQTFLGHAYWPLDPSQSEVFIEDISHALSMICRYGGHSSRFYSVAEHCIHVSHLVTPENALVGLLHDAPEAYLGDVIRPLKRFLGGYKDIERMNWAVIAQRFSVPYELPREVHEADNLACVTETRELMLPSPIPQDDWRVTVTAPSAFKVQCFSPEEANRFFLARFYELAYPT